MLTRFLWLPSPIHLTAASSLPAVKWADDVRRGGNYAKLWDAKTGERVATLDGFADSVEALAFSPDGKKLVGSCRNTSFHIWDVSKYVK